MKKCNGVPHPLFMVQLGILVDFLFKQSPHDVDGLKRLSASSVYAVSSSRIHQRREAQKRAQSRWSLLSRQVVLTNQGLNSYNF